MQPEGQKSPKGKVIDFYKTTFYEKGDIDQKKFVGFKEFKDKCDELGFSDPSTEDYVEVFLFTNRWAQKKLDAASVEGKGIGELSRVFDCIPVSFFLQDSERKTRQQQMCAEVKNMLPQMLEAEVSIGGHGAVEKKHLNRDEVLDSGNVELLQSFRVGMMGSGKSELVATEKLKGLLVERSFLLSQVLLDESGALKERFKDFFAKAKGTLEKKLVEEETGGGSQKASDRADQEVSKQIKWSCIKTYGGGIVEFNDGDDLFRNTLLSTWVAPFTQKIKSADDAIKRSQELLAADELKKNLGSKAFKATGKTYATGVLDQVILDYAQNPGGYSKTQKKNLSDVLDNAGYPKLDSMTDPNKCVDMIRSRMSPPPPKPSDDVKVKIATAIIKNADRSSKWWFKAANRLGFKISPISLGIKQLESFAVGNRLYGKMRAALKRFPNLVKYFPEKKGEVDRVAVVGKLSQQQESAAGSAARDSVVIVKPKKEQADVVTTAPKHK
jgi:hypothetical protein